MLRGDEKMKVCLSCGLYRNEEAFPVGEYQDVCVYCWNNQEQIQIEKEKEDEKEIYR